MAWLVVRDALLVLAVAPVIYYLIAIFAAAAFFRVKPGRYSEVTPETAPTKTTRASAIKITRNSKFFFAWVMSAMPRFL
jgi:hypothetical protein